MRTINQQFLNKYNTILNSLLKYDYELMSANLDIQTIIGLIPLIEHNKKIVEGVFDPETANDKTNAGYRKIILEDFLKLSKIKENQKNRLNQV